MLFGLFTVKVRLPSTLPDTSLSYTRFQESPRWLASVGKREEALQNLAYLRRDRESSVDVLSELAEIEAAIEEERIAREDLGWQEAFFGKGNFVRFVIAFVIFLLQQWSGQNSVGYVISGVPSFISNAHSVSYYAPQIFASVSPSRWMFSGQPFNGLSRLVMTVLQAPCLHRVSTGSSKCENFLFVLSS